MADVEPYEDPIIRLIQDPNLNRDKAKTSELIKIISGFPLAERKVSKLCLSTFAILQTLEKLSLTFKSWEFLSLDFNSEYHFSNQDDKLKRFNNNVADKVITTCNEMNKKLNRISIDIDSITKASRTLSPVEYISDSGTLLTSLVLRSIKLKNEVVDNLTVAYLKAKLILIGKDLEAMLMDAEDDTTILTYKNFIVNLLKQLNSAIELEDAESKYECLAVMNDMEKMFDAFKLEKVREVAVRKSKDEEPEDTENDQEELHPHNSTPNTQQLVSDDDVDFDYSDSDVGSNSLYSSTLSQPPMIHSITKSHVDSSPRVTRRDSVSSLSTSTLLHKTTISDEMPYLMTAFSSAKNIEEDISHFQEEEKIVPQFKKRPEKEYRSREKEVEKKEKHFYSHKPKLPENSLYSESVILSQPTPGSSPASSYLFSNNSLLSKLGIKPQVITTDVPHGKELAVTGKLNQPQQQQKLPLAIEASDDEDTNKENKKLLTPLTKANLETHTFSKLTPENGFADYVD
ncbi:uncharacterized protein CANTADRAFT_49849 [Suhomyces tanzawaensis NRRL Y-17324]|uniref:Uncharacterized protein n=1 Tax=Suhomyces tanzawaensis NRRL Y-17324 TaxID=984487 RepID=A0A1E4SL09_9ASCO|nr:uncharacterized protein CANTADRAFT_49849 [Suhomyces tanzawaensis NRRL Y-17324]ODV80122.1 hypothetical protein CANTADRAFT_49849 [Suhomyces tanzawaensis NRRL Y-17324]